MLLILIILIILTAVIVPIYFLVIKKNSNNNNNNPNEITSLMSMIVSTSSQIQTNPTSSQILTNPTSPKIQTNPTSPKIQPEINSNTEVQTTASLAQAIYSPKILAEYKSLISMKYSFIEYNILQIKNILSHLESNSSINPFDSILALNKIAPKNNIVGINYITNYDLLINSKIYKPIYDLTLKCLNVIKSDRLPNLAEKQYILYCINQVNILMNSLPTFSSELLKSKKDIFISHTSLYKGIEAMITDIKSLFIYIPKLMSDPLINLDQTSNEYQIYMKTYLDQAQNLQQEYNNAMSQLIQKNNISTQISDQSSLIKEYTSKKNILYENFRTANITYLDLVITPRKNNLLNQNMSDSLKQQVYQINASQLEAKKQGLKYTPETAIYIITRIKIHYDILAINEIQKLINSSTT